MKLTILGCNGALPAYGRFPSSQILDLGMELFLIDCGEGAQLQMGAYSVKPSRINNIFISHLHGDHYFGLVGFINSQGLLGRTKEMHIYATAKLKDIIAIQTDWPLPFEIIYHDLQDGVSEILIDNPKFQVRCFPLDHSVPTHGFLFTKKGRLRSLLPDKIQEFEIPKYFYSQLAEGKDYTKQDGTIVLNCEVTQSGKGNKTFAYCSDTGYFEDVLAAIFDVDTLYHEATYLENELDKAIARKHATAKQAATIAKKANAKKLIIGHYSSKYKSIDEHLIEAKEIFDNTELGVQGQVYEL
jgi:ribonuclease Z